MNDTPLKQLCYISKATHKFTTNELVQLTTNAQKFNKQVGVTGVLLFNAAGTFMQVLEGPVAEVESLYQHIKLDPRHQRVTIVATNQIKARDFSAWHMGLRLDVGHFSHGLSQFFDKNIPINQIPELSNINSKLTAALDEFKSASNEILI